MEISHKRPAPPPEPRDAELVRAAIEEDLGAREMLALRLMDRVRTTVMYMAGPGPRAEDLAQTALVEILRSLHNYRGDGSVESWADRITRRVVSAQLKQRWRKQELLTLDTGPRTEAEEDRGSLAGDPGIDIASPERETGRRELAERLARVVSQLRPRHRWVVILRWVHGYSIQEIAEQTDTKLNTVRERLRTGKKKLRSLIQRDPVLRNWPELLEE